MATNFETKLTITLTPLKIIARCLHVPSIFGSGLSDDAAKIFPCRLLLPWQRILGQNWL